MRIVADENIPFVEEFFSTIGTVETLPGRSMTAAHVRDADVLLVRSVTSVDRALLEGSRVQFVGTCTIGVDHLDLEYLDDTGINYASAPGCNAISVVEYVFSVLAQVRPDWLSKKFGIIGCGNVGGALYRQLKRLGLDVCFYDPLLDVPNCPHLDAGDQATLEQVLSMDVVSMHAPLTLKGDFPSRHLIGRRQLAQLKPGALLINAGRGPVIDNDALVDFLQGRDDVDVALDVWEHEPVVDLQLLPLIAVSSPHIAGYSFDGKVAGTAMIYQSLCDLLAREACVDAAALLEAPKQEVLLGAETLQAAVNTAILKAYDAAQDDARLRQRLQQVVVDHSLEARGQALGLAFDRLRKEYPLRREFFMSRVALKEPNLRVEKERQRLMSVLSILGFTVNDQVC